MTQIKASDMEAARVPSRLELGKASALGWSIAAARKHSAASRTGRRSLHMLETQLLATITGRSVRADWRSPSAHCAPPVPRVIIPYARHNRRRNVAFHEQIQRRSLRAAPGYRPG